jgi:hypothetical protein
LRILTSQALVIARTAHFNLSRVLCNKSDVSSLKMAARQNMLEGMWWIKYNKIIQNCACSWFLFLKLNLMQDEQYKKRAGKLSYVLNVKLLRNAGDLPSVQTGHRQGTEWQEQERQENKSEEDWKHDAATTQMTRGDWEKSLHSSSFWMYFEIWL